MKLTALLLVAFCLHVSAEGYSQTISFSGKNVPLSTVFASIEKQTGLSFFFNFALIKDVKPVTLEVQDVPLEEALNKVLNGEGLDFYRTGKTIFIVKRQAAIAVDPVPQPVSQIDITGRVVNHLGESMPSATVAVKNTNKITLTNAKGVFEIKNVSVGATVQISYQGYQNADVKVTGSEMMFIQMRLTDNQLDAPQVIAYGNTTQRLTTGNISLVKGEDIDKQAVNNPLAAIEGRVPGLFITQANGMAGSAMTVRVQGQNSILSGNDPLFVIDGVPYVSQMLSTTNLGPFGLSGGPAGSGSGNPLSFINTSDIESIEVLKDADATAIYGSRAANGAILITTKKGKSGKEKVSIGFQNGWGAVTRKLPLMNTPQYLQMRNEALNNDGISSPSMYDYDVNNFWDSTRYTDWQKVLLGNTSRYTNINGSITGGTVSTQYLVSGTYHRETSAFPGSFNDEKASVHFNLNTISTNQKFRMQLIASYLIDNNKLPVTDLTSQALTLAPDAPKLRNADGSLNWQLDQNGAATWSNPLAFLYTNYQGKTYNLGSNGNLSYFLIPGLEIRANLGYNNLRTNELTSYSLLSNDPVSQIQLGASARQAQYSNSTIESWIIEPQIEYKKFLGGGKIDVLLGATVNQRSSTGISLTGVGYTTDALLPDINSAATIYSNQSVAANYKYEAIFGRVNYNWQDKYIIDLNMRRDGSSRFGSANQFHNFASAGTGWIFSEEKLIKDNFSALSFGKIRGSYGITGNDQIGDYKFMNLYNSFVVGVPYQLVTGLVPAGLPNPYLQWEKTQKLQFGIDLGFFKNRILLTANYIYNKSSNELVNFALPSVAGFNTITENIPAVIRNTAEELVLNTINIKSGRFTWASSFNITIPQNKLLSYYSSNGKLPGNIFIGKPLGVTPEYKFGGVNSNTGLYQFVSSHGDLTSTPSATTDKTVLLNKIFPQYYGGFQNTFRYRQFQLDVFFQFVRKYVANDNFGTAMPGVFNTNQPVFILDRWQKIGDNSSTQRYNSNYSLVNQYTDAANSDMAFNNFLYMRLKNLSISWSALPSDLKALHLQGLNMFLQAQNLWTITKFKGLDPETGNSSLPPLRIITVGAQIDF